MKKLILLLGLTGIVIAVLENIPVFKERGSLLMTLVFWITIIEGSIAAVAVCDLVNAKWVKSLKKEMLALYPLLFLFSFLFILLAPQMDLYPWMEQQGAWLNKTFFLTRNIAVLLITSFAAWRFALKSSREDKDKNSSAVIYLFLFVLSQSLVAFDWVMSLEYPWYSTIFGAYFFVEAIYAGFAMGGILFLLRQKKNRDYLRDIATLLFGFSILWGGLFFTQFLVIWYGNLPEEVGFITHRIAASPYLEMSYFIIISIFAVPFLILLPRVAKTNPWVVSFVSLTILLGILIERLLYLKPVLPFDTVLFLLESAGILFLCIVLIRGKDILSKKNIRQD